MRQGFALGGQLVGFFLGFAMPGVGLLGQTQNPTGDPTAPDSSAASYPDGFQVIAQSYVVAERGAHHKTWNKEVTLRDGIGNTVLQTNQAYGELQTGMHYRDADTGHGGQGSTS